MKNTEYESPRISDYGDLTEITAQQTVGTVADRFVQIQPNQPIPTDIATTP